METDDGGVNVKKLNKYKGCCATKKDIGTKTKNVRTYRDLFPYLSLIYLYKLEFLSCAGYNFFLSEFLRSWELRKKKVTIVSNKIRVRITSINYFFIDAFVLHYDKHYYIGFIFQ